MKTIVTSLLIFEETDGPGPRRLWTVYSKLNSRQMIGSVWFNHRLGGYVFDPAQGESFTKGVLFGVVDFLTCLTRGDFK